MPREPYESNTPLNVLRCFFVIAAGSLGWSIARAMTNIQDWFIWQNLLGFGIGIALSIATIVLEARFSRGFYPTIFAIVFGLLVGFVSAYFFLQGMSLIPHYSSLQEQAAESIRGVTTIFLCYITVSLFLKAKDEFTLLVPFVRFAQQERFKTPKVLDTSVIIDGRIAELCKTNLVDGPLLIPRFVLDELQAIADSDNRPLRLRGQRGLQMLQQLQQIPNLQTSIDEEDIPSLEGSDQKTIELARRRGAQVLTCDYNLKTMAGLHGIPISNLNEVALALKTRVLPGEEIRVHLLREGENPGQACGYLPDGTLVIVEHARDRIGHEIALEVTSVIQKPQGNLVFGKPKP